MRQRVWEGRTGGGNIGQKGLYWFFRFIDVRFGYLGLRFAVIFYMIFARQRCLAIYRYFRQQHGYSVWKSWCKTYRNHYLFGQTVLDKFAVFSGNAKHYRLTVSGKEHFERILEGESGCIVASSHVGNFEIAGYLMGQSKKRMNGIIFGGEAEVVQHLRSGILGSHNVRLIPVSSDMSHIFQIHAALSAGEIVSMPCDRVFSGNKIVEYDFLGGRACFPAGAYYLAERFKVKILAFFVMKEAPLHYHLHIRPLQIVDSVNIGKEDRVRALGECFVSELSDIVKKYPEQWYNFYNFWNTNG